VSVECDQNGLEIVLGGGRSQGRDQSLVTPVNAVELADGDGGRAKFGGLA
jgi:hypothetical protein